MTDSKGSDIFAVVKADNDQFAEIVARLHYFRQVLQGSVPQNGVDELPVEVASILDVYHETSVVAIIRSIERDNVYKTPYGSGKTLDTPLAKARGALASRLDSVHNGYKRNYGVTYFKFVHTTDLQMLCTIKV